MPSHFAWPKVRDGQVCPMLRCAKHIYTLHPSNQFCLFFSENQVMDMKSRESIGDTLISNEMEAKECQKNLEKALRTKLNFQIRQGDLILTRFDQIPKSTEAVKKNHSVGHSYVSKSSLHWNISSLFYALFVQWSITPRGQKFFPSTHF